MAHSHWKLDFIHRLMHYKGIIICIECQIWTSLNIPTKSLKNIQDFVTWGKKSSRIHKECLNNFFWPKIFTTNTLYLNVYKIYECDKNQMLYCNVKSFEKSNFWEFWAIDGTWPHWINFIILTFISEKNRYFKSLHKIWNKIISLDMRKKRWNVR
jgi:hypothetical protein